MYCLLCNYHVLSKYILHHILHEIIHSLHLTCILLYELIILYIYKVNIHDILYINNDILPIIA